MKIFKFFLYGIMAASSTMYSQNQKRLIEDICECTSQIDTSTSDKEKLVMNCALKGYTKNRAYTTKAVSEYTEKSTVDGTDVLMYHINIFDKILTDKCDAYNKIMAEVLGVGKLNPITKNIGSQICSSLSPEASEDYISSQIEQSFLENRDKIMSEYETDDQKNFVSDVNLYLFYTCRAYRLNTNFTFENPLAN